MFKFIERKVKNSEKAEVYSLLDAGLIVCGRLIELLVILSLAVGLAQYLASLFGQIKGPFPYNLLAWGPASLVLALSVCPRLALRSTLRKDFGLDSRPFLIKFRGAFGPWLALWALLWLASWLIFNFLITDRLLFFGTTLLALVWGSYLAYCFVKNRLICRSLVEWPPFEKVSFFPPQVAPLFNDNSPFEQLKVSHCFWPGIKLPFFLGRILVIPKSSINFLSSEALKISVVWAYLAKYVKLDRYRLFLRLSTLALAVPSAFVSLIALGFFFLSYPFKIGPGLVPLALLGAWFSVLFSNLAENLFNRLFIVKLNQGAVLATGDEKAMAAVIRLLAEKNLLAAKRGWRWVLFTDWAGADELLSSNLQSKSLLRERKELRASKSKSLKNFQGQDSEFSSKDNLANLNESLKEDIEKKEEKIIH
ncbi:MAG: hypothetical protein LBV23_11740 [Deltaproteobacteria bacterium]|jgi:hypothetical protein|nr:hypothetical protein [Deltaproteobacteria bacterium]